MITYQPTAAEIGELASDDPALDRCIKRMEDVESMFEAYCNALQPEMDSLNLLGQQMGFPPASLHDTWDCFIGNMWDVLHFGKHGEDNTGQQFSLPTTTDEWLAALIQQYRANVACVGITGHQQS